MFMKDDKNKRVAALIISRKKDGASEPEMKPAPVGDDGVPKDFEMGMNTAAEELISAVESKDPKKLVEAAKSLISMIKDEHESEEEMD